MNQSDQIRRIVVEMADVWTEWQWRRKWQESSQHLGQFGSAEEQEDGNNAIKK